MGRKGYNNQHINPATYLKYFANEKFVHFINLADPYKKHIQKEGIGYKVFYEKQYYDFPNRRNEPVLEKMFSKIEHKTYNSLIAKIENKDKLGFDEKCEFIEWLMMMKFRNTKFRDNMSEKSEWLAKTMYGLKYGKEAMTKKSDEFSKEGMETGKIMQLDIFLDKERNREFRKAFFMSFIFRHWSILSSEKSNFITSDNPGFSVTFCPHLERLNMNPLSSMYNLDKGANSFHVFPLTYNKCLYLSPITNLDPSKKPEDIAQEVNHREIEVKESLGFQVDMINQATAELAYKLIIGKEKKDLTKFEIKTKNTTGNNG